MGKIHFLLPGFRIGMRRGQIGIKFEWGMCAGRWIDIDESNGF